VCFILKGGIGVKKNKEVIRHHIDGVESMQPRHRRPGKLQRLMGRIAFLGTVVFSYVRNNIRRRVIPQL